MIREKRRVKNSFQNVDNLRPEWPVGSLAGAALKRKRECEGRCEGRKPLRETRPEVVALARKLRRRKPKGGQLSLRKVSSELAASGFLNERGKPYAAKSVASMLR